MMCYFRQELDKCTGMSIGQRELVVRPIQTDFGLHISKHIQFSLLSAASMSLERRKYRISCKKT